MTTVGLQLHPDILEVEAASTVSALSLLEGKANPNGLCGEWVARHWQALSPAGRDAAAAQSSAAHPRTPPPVQLRPQSMPDVFFNAGSLAPLFKLQCRSHPRKSNRALPGGCPHEHDAEVDATLRNACGIVLSKAVGMLGERIEALLAAVNDDMSPNIRLKVGADVTLRRTVKGKHGDDVVPTGDINCGDLAGAKGKGAASGSCCTSTSTTSKSSDGDGENGAGGDDTTFASSYLNAPVHCDSWDGTILCFGLCSTKLGTPVYPDAVFPRPLQEFMSQSGTGRSYPSQLPTDDTILGPRRAWKAGTMVVLPAACAHSRPDENVEADSNPSVPRWFTRVTLRIAIVDGDLQERLQLSILVAKHVWGDSIFAQAAADAHAAAEQAKWMKLASAAAAAAAGGLGSGETGKNGFGYHQYINGGGVYEGGWKDGRHHGLGVMQFANGDCYDGAWKEGKQCGVGVMKYAPQRQTTAGKGKIKAVIYSDVGNVYTGEWRDGLREGQGVFVWHKGPFKFIGPEYARGHWMGCSEVGAPHQRPLGKIAMLPSLLTDVRSILMVLLAFKGHVYDGGWLKGKQHGLGTKLWPNGNIHTGNWAGGKPEGQCVFTFGTNKLIFKGNFGESMSEIERAEYRAMKDALPKAALKDSHMSAKLC